MAILITKWKLNEANQISPMDFLNWSKEDLQTKDKKSIGNGISNIKKCIHSRIDEIIDQTHISYCKNWPLRPNLKTKIEALGILNIQFTSIVTLLTYIRNKYEHCYLLPDYKDAIAYLETAEIWLERSYDKYSFNKIAIPSLNIDKFGVYSGKKGEMLTSCEIIKGSNLDFIWENKREIHEIKNGILSVTKMENVDWKKMAKYEAKNINLRPSNKSEYTLSNKNILLIYKKARKINKI